jgi:hypothetical protein
MGSYRNSVELISKSSLSQMLVSVAHLRNSAAAARHLQRHNQAIRLFRTVMKSGTYDFFSFSSTTASHFVLSCSPVP